MQDIEALESRLDFQFPEDCRTLYLTMNGFGVGDLDSDDADTSFLVPPLEQLEEFGDAVRNWFSETHPKAASDFVPVIDFHNGDAIGYRRSDDGLFMFESGRLKYDSGQESDEFLWPLQQETLMDFFQPR